MLELIFQGLIEWIYGLILECWEYFVSVLMELLSVDFAYMREHIPVMDEIMEVILAVGWALLIGNLVFQALKSMLSGLGFAGEDPKLLFTRTFVFAFLLMASPEICEIGLSLTANVIALLDMPDAADVTLVDDSVFGTISAAWVLVIIFNIIIMFKVFRLLLEVVERYVILAFLTFSAPLAFGVGGSRNTSDIFTGWCRMYGSMCLLMATNMMFFKMLLSAVSSIPGGVDALPWMALVWAIVKTAQKADSIITRIGLNPAITGEGAGGRSLPGMLTYSIVRAASRQVVQSAGKTVSGSAGKAGGSGARPAGVNSANNVGASRFGGAAGKSESSSQNTQTASVKPNQSQSSNTQNGPQQSSARQNISSSDSANVSSGAQSSANITNTAQSGAGVHSGTMRRTSVASNARRGNSYVRSFANGAAGRSVTAAAPTAYGEGGQAENSSVISSSLRQSSAAFEAKSGASSAGRPSAAQPTSAKRTAEGSTAGTPQSQSTRFSACNARRVNGGRTENRTSVSEQSNVSVNNRESSRQGVSESRQSEASRNGGAAYGKTDNRENAAVSTRFSSRGEATSDTRFSSASNKGQGAANVRSVSDEIVSARSSARPDYAAERYGRNGTSENGTERSSPTRPERAPRSGAAGMAGNVNGASSTRQTVRGQNPSAVTEPRSTAVGSARQEKARTDKTRRSKRNGNGGKNGR
ncbi:MAG: hypothetical protein LUC36_03045 [Oscillospiraceae bacterium]|nr:hypothetical protein [Oscillospiraceae bacterium]